MECWGNIPSNDKILRKALLSQNKDYLLYDLFLDRQKSSMDTILVIGPMPQRKAGKGEIFTFNIIFKLFI